MPPNVGCKDPQQQPNPWAHQQIGEHPAETNIAYPLNLSPFPFQRGQQRAEQDELRVQAIDLKREIKFRMH